MSLALDPHRDPSPWIRPLLDIGESLYAAAIAIRRAAYEAGLIERKRASRPVISVGNLAVGGTGKTPFVIMLANRFAERGLRIAVLSRGYGRLEDDPLVLVSEGAGPLVSAVHAGDEPILIAERTRAIVLVSRDRARAAEIAVGSFGADLLLLDDGFQHWRLARELDLVLLDRSAPLGNGRLLPRGPLRESVDALSRADLLVLVGDEGDRTLDLPDRPIVEVSVVPTLVSIDGESRPAATLAGRSVALISGIARPERFLRTVERLGAIVVHRDRRPDHGIIDDLDPFFSEARRAGAELCLTTEKDAARMGASRSARLGVLAIEHRIARGEELLDQALARVVA